MGTPYFCFTITVFLLCICDGVSGFTNPNDAAILDILESNWGNTAPQNWIGSDPCGSQWDGITCTSSGQIIELALSSMGLQGTLPFDIGQLSELQRLDLSYNKQLTGQLPNTLGNLVNLQNLAMIGCDFSGNIPDGLGNLVKLELLALNSNKLTGSIPPSLGNLLSISWLDLADNQLTGTLPVSNSSYTGLDKLFTAQHFHFNQNNLSGQIPSDLFSSNMSLIHVLFNSNKFSGEIPATVGLLKRLETLRLDRNSFTGPIPSNISDLQNLFELHLSNNKLEDLIPDLSGLTNLQYLDLSNNSFESSTFPSWLTTLQDLTTVVLENCNLTGQIPSSFFDLAFLETVDLGDNHLNGTVVLNSSISQVLQVIELQNNNISNAPQLGNADISIVLQGNPFCQSHASGSSNFCQIYSGKTSYETSLAQCGGKKCSMESFKVNPRTCQCQQPFQGQLQFRAPSFSDIADKPRFQRLEQTLQSNLSVDAVYLCCLYLTASIISICRFSFFLKMV